MFPTVTRTRDDLVLRRNLPRLKQTGVRPEIVRPEMELLKASSSSVCNSRGSLYMGVLMIRALLLGSNKLTNKESCLFHVSPELGKSLVPVQRMKITGAYVYWASVAPSSSGGVPMRHVGKLSSGSGRL